MVEHRAVNGRCRSPSFDKTFRQPKSRSCSTASRPERAKFNQARRRRRAWRRTKGRLRRMKLLLGEVRQGAPERNVDAVEALEELQAEIAAAEGKTSTASASNSRVIP